jgi:hypothetical protein
MEYAQSRTQPAAIEVERWRSLGATSPADVAAPGRAHPVVLLEFKLLLVFSCKVVTLLRHSGNLAPSCLRIFGRGFSLVVGPRRMGSLAMNATVLADAR